MFSYTCLNKLNSVIYALFYVNFLFSLITLRYCRGSLLKSINIPYANAFSSDGTLDHPSLRNSKGKIIAIIGSNKDKLSSEVSFIIFFKSTFKFKACHLLLDF